MKKFTGVLLLVGCLACTSGCRTSKQGYVAKGNKLYDAGKYDEAVINYSKAIQKDQRYGEAYYRMGLAEIKAQRPSKAFEALYRAVPLLPANIEAKEQLGALALEFYLLDPQRPQRYYNLVKQTSGDLLQKNPGSFEGLREEAYLAMTDGKRDEAIALFRKALAVNPSDVIVTTALIQNMMVVGQGKEAEALALNLIARQKSYGKIYGVLYEWYSRENRPADAENILKARVRNNPKDGAALLELAAHYDQARKPSEMQATLQQLLDNPKDFPQGRLWVGDFYLKLRNYAEAVRYFEEGARSSQGTAKALYEKRATEALLLDGKGAQASSTVDQLVRENPKDQDAKRIQADMLLESGNPEKLAAAEREFEELSKQRPDDPSIWFGLGRAQEARGNLDAAKAQYLQALNKNQNYLPARYALAQIGLIQKRPNEALLQTSEILKLRPDDPSAQLLHAQALARTGNAATARSELTNIKDFQHNPQAQVELGMLALSEKKFAEAEQIFTKVSQTGNPQAISGLAKAYASEKQFDKALGVLNDGLRKSGDSPILLAQLANTQSLAGKYDAATATYQKLATLEPKSAQVQLQLAYVLALRGDDGSALASFREAAKLAPADLAIGLEFAGALSRSGHVDEARTQYEEVLKAHPNEALALNGMAFFISEHGGNLDQAMALAQRALQASPGQPSYSDTIGCIYLKKGLNDSALQVFRNLVTKYPNYSTFRYHLGMALIEKGDKKGAEKELETALAAHPSRQDQARIKQLLSRIS